MKNFFLEIAKPSFLKKKIIFLTLRHFQRANILPLKYTSLRQMVCIHIFLNVPVDDYSHILLTTATFITVQIIQITLKGTQLQTESCKRLAKWSNQEQRMPFSCTKLLFLLTSLRAVLVFST